MATEARATLSRLLASASSRLRLGCPCTRMMLPIDTMAIRKICPNDMMRAKGMAMGNRWGAHPQASKSGPVNAQTKIGQANAVEQRQPQPLAQHALRVFGVLLTEQHGDAVPRACAHQQAQRHGHHGQGKCRGDHGHAVGPHATPHQHAIHELVKRGCHKAGNGRKRVTNQQAPNRVLAHVTNGVHGGALGYHPEPPTAMPLSVGTARPNFLSALHGLFDFVEGGEAGAGA